MCNAILTAFCGGSVDVGTVRTRRVAEIHTSSVADTAELEAAAPHHATTVIVVVAAAVSPTRKAAGADASRGLFCYYIIGTRGWWRYEKDLAERT